MLHRTASIRLVAPLSVRGVHAGLDRVDRRVDECGDVGVRFALGDEREDLGFSFGETFGSAWPVEADRDSVFARGWTGDRLAFVDSLERFDEFSGGERLG